MKEKVEQAVRDGRVVAIMRGMEPETCLRLAEAYLAGGIRAVEVTYVQTDRALWVRTTAAIRAIAERFGGELCVGAGTVLNSEQLAMTRDADGEFIVTPNTRPALIRECVGLGLAAIPGAMTPSEAVEAYDSGASFVKIFPAGSLGPSYVKALRAPLAHIPFLAVGGITPDNAAEFMRVGCVGIGVSGALTNRELVAAGAWDRITDVAKTLVERTRT